MYNRPPSLWIFDVLYPDGDLTSNNLLHSERVNDLAAIVRQLSRFVWRDHGDQAGSGHFTRVSREYPVYLFPDLQLGCIETYSEKGAGEVCVSPAYLAQEGAGDGAEEAGYNGDAGGTLGDAVAHGGGDVVVERLGERAGGGVKVVRGRGGDYVF